MKLFNVNLLFLYSVVFCCISVCHGGVYGSNSPVVSLTSSTFKKQLKESRDVWVVVFYAPWCGHCNSLQPEFEKAATSVSGVVRFGAINCDDEKQLCGSHSIKGFPTIKIFPHMDKDEPIDYQQQRKAKDIKKEALSFVRSQVRNINSAEYLDDFLRDSHSDNKVLLFTEKSKTAPLFKALSMRFNKIMFGEVNKKSEEIVNKFNVASFPSIVVFSGDEEGTPYTGEMNADSLDKYLSTLVPAETKKSAKPKSEPKPKKAKPEEKHESVEKEIEFQPPLPSIKKAEEVTESSFEHLCPSTGKSRCVIVSVPVGDLSEGDPGIDRLGAIHIKNKELLETLPERFRADPLRFHWLAANEHNKFLAHLGLESNVANVIVFHLKKNRFAVMPAGESGIGEYAVDGEATQETEETAKSSDVLNMDHTITFIERVLGGDVKYKKIPDVDENQKLSSLLNDNQEIEEHYSMQNCKPQ